ncbi:MAG TPA: ATP-binding protein [Pyrinomonadaceae bacterium]|nr:ATP-binding protein [Pyrinomonadaceae bacterium]
MVRLRLNLQAKILLVVAGSMLLILVASSYLHSGRIRSLIERDHYDSAVNQTVALSDRIAKYDYFSNLEDLQQEMQLVVSSRPDFKQIDVYENQQTVPQLIATTATGTANLLSALDSDDQTNAASTTPINNDNGEFWLISVPINAGSHTGAIKALVLKSYHRKLVSSLHREYNFVLFGAVIASVILLYLLFVYFFRKPVKEIVQTMAQARKGDLSVRARVHRDDELGEIASGFNQMMDDISSLNSELVRKVRLVTTELQTANGNLLRTQQRLSHAERMAAIGQVTASLAHEIGTPLNAIAGHLQLLARNHPSCGDTQRRLTIVNAQLGSIVQTVKTLLERTHRRPIVPQPTDINNIIEELLLLVAPLLESRNIRVSQNLDRSLPHVFADRESLHQVFLNLVNNSIEAMPEGGEMEFVTKYVHEAELIEVRFIDSGTGICSEAKDHLFEPMWTNKKSGSGLGLAIAKEIMLEHRGRIDCLEVEKGAEFRVLLPVVAAELGLESRLNHTGLQPGAGTEGYSRKPFQRFSGSRQGNR